MMCRLYGFLANQNTKVECNLVHAQNALLKQGIQDRDGLTHGHGWGMGAYLNDDPVVEKRSWAAWHGQHFAEAAARISSRTVISHVRRATVGIPSIENTHPFTDGRWLFAHNGTVPQFDKVKPTLLSEIAPQHRKAINGATDSEHVFRYFLTLLEQSPDQRPQDVLHHCLSRVIDICSDINPSAMPALNTIITNGKSMLGSRLGRTLWFLERKGMTPCEYCGKHHTLGDPLKEFRSIEVASEPITQEDWHQIPNSSIFFIAPTFDEIHFTPIDNNRLAQWQARVPA